VLQKKLVKGDHSVVAYITPVGADEQTGPIRTITMDIKSFLNGHETRGPVNFYELRDSKLKNGHECECPRPCV